MTLTNTTILNLLLVILVVGSHWILPRSHRFIHIGFLIIILSVTHFYVNSVIRKRVKYGVSEIIKGRNLKEECITHELVKREFDKEKMRSKISQ